MSAVYLEYNFTIEPTQPGTEILIAELGYAGFESFVETEKGVLAYIQKDEWSEGILQNIQILQNNTFTIEFLVKEIAQENWNQTWESNFEPILVNDLCAVRAPFHEPFKVPFEIIIEPKMSFGTGHHETTFMMLQLILENDFKDKTVLDMGCGTSVLAILAEKRGATQLNAIDIDAWCVENSEENITRNNCTSISVQQGDASLLSAERKYHIIIANINRNILLNDIPTYVGSLQKNGELYLSGFYQEDLKMITDCCNKNGLQFVENKEKNNWIAAKYVFL